MKGVTMVERCSTVSRFSRQALLGSVALSAALSVHCGGGAELPAASVPHHPEPVPVAPSTTAATPDPFAMPARLREDVLPPEGLRDPDLAKWAAARKLPGIGPASCNALAQVPKKKSVACEKPAIEAVVSALHTGDAALAELETCPAFPPGYIRSLRAESAAPECADLYVDELLEHPKQGTPAPLMHVMVGQSVAAKLLRTGLNPPSLAGISGKDKILAYYNKTLGPWYKEQYGTVEQLSQIGAALQGYGRAIAATEAGYAELRFVDTLRGGATPKEWDAELKQYYESALEDSMTPMKQRGRDATLVGFGVMAMLDLPDSPRVHRARTLLAKMYGGRRIDALDALMLNDNIVLDLPGTPQATFHLRMLSPAAKDPDASAPLAIRIKAAERHLLRGATFWRAVDYDRVLALVGADAAKDDKARLYSAIALAMRQGPADAYHFMNAATPADLNLLHTEALDMMAKEQRPNAGMAAFDAALLREIAPPVTGQREHFTDVAKRYEDAAKLLDGGRQSAAKSRAEGARALAAAIK